MCVNKKELLDLCDLFPQTADNIKRKAMERRKRFIKQKNLNSKKYWEKRGRELIQETDKDPRLYDESGNLALWVKAMFDEGKTMGEIEAEWPYVEQSTNGQENFHSDEEPENSESQKEDMKIYLSKLNKKIDILVDSLKDAEIEIKNQSDRKNINDLLKGDAEGKNIERPSISVYFND